MMAVNELGDHLETLSYREDSDGVGILSLARPPVNALGQQLVVQLGTALEQLESRQSLRALVVTGAGRTFCAGADLKERQTMSEADVRRFVATLSATFTRLARLPVPTAAAINGTAAGGGCELALACDFRIMDESGRLGLPETTLGIVPGAGGTQRLPRLIGPSRAKQWIFSGELFTAEEALAHGAVDLSVPAARVVSAACTFMAGMARSAPLALQAAKQAIDTGFGLPLNEGLQVESQAYLRILSTEDRLEALAAFKEKRRPAFKGR